MTWLVPALVATTANSAVLAAIYLYLSRSERDVGMGVLTLAWTLYTVRFMLMLFHVLTDAGLLLVANQLAVLASAHLLMVGVRRWLGLRPWPSVWVIAVSACGVWIIAGGFAGLLLPVLSLPVLLYAGIAFIVSGVLVLRSSARTGSGVTVVGVALILWGIHKIDYPFLRPIESFAPWGYLLGALLAMVIGIGMVLVYFEDARNRLSDAVTEREILMREIHHRVKNNLGIIYALLQFQKHPGLDATTEQALTTVQNRVTSMSLIHEQLYSGDDLAHLDADSYLTALVSHVRDSEDSGGAEISVTTHVEPLRLAPETAVPCGLIVNELVSNALRFAFPGRSEGNLDVSLLSQDGTCTLCVRDDGVGWDTSADDGPGLGRGIVARLAQQLGGTVTIESNSGTSVSVSFPLPGDA